MNRFTSALCKIMLLLLTLLLIDCTGLKSNSGGLAAGLKSIDIEAPAFFWLLQPWKGGTLATIDEQA
jgi:hypothetical protein